MCNAPLDMACVNSLNSTAQTPSPSARSARFQLAPSVWLCSKPDISFTTQRCMPEHICRPGGNFGWRDFFFFLEQGVRKFLPGVGSGGLVWVKVPIQLCSASDGCGQVLCWEGFWVTSEVCPACKEAVHLPGRSGDACELISVWNKASDWNGSGRMRKDCFSEIIFFLCPGYSWLAFFFFFFSLNYV